MKPDTLYTLTIREPGGSAELVFYGPCARLRRLLAWWLLRVMGRLSQTPINGQWEVQEHWPEFLQEKEPINQ